LLSLAAMAVSTLHILLDFGVGIFPMRDRLSPVVMAMVLLIAFIHVWWCVSLIAGAQGNGGGLASAAILGLGWTLLTNGFPITECMPPCPYAAPLSDIAHIGSIVLGLIAPVVTIWTLWRHRATSGTGMNWMLAIGALLLVVTTIVSLANSFEA
jgi:hypothetical protein